ncbi:hypothetical protein [Bradyrhizobium monzae]|uniref:hypothetical protein n=1 Tax=Bradyrhizobium sp. Oc8 TaxID=2876780 RepID=UPI001F2FF14E|nr:hypothetical protein [Bradyrhizobium sp. Oc8]
MADVVGAASTLLVVCRIEASRGDAHRLLFFVGDVVFSSQGWWIRNTMRLMTDTKRAPHARRFRIEYVTALLRNSSSLASESLQLLFFELDKNPQRSRRPVRTYVRGSRISND